MPDSDARIARLEESQKNLHEKVDRLADSLDNHIATEIKMVFRTLRMVFKTMGAVIGLLLGVLATLLFPYFSGGS